MSIVDPHQKADEYLERHSIRPVIQGCIAQLLYHKPNDPKKFLVQHLEALKVSGKRPQLLNKKDLNAMFHMFDITGRGWCSVQQADNAIATIVGTAQKPSETDEEKEAAAERAAEQLTQHQFVEYIASQLNIAE